MKVLLVEDSLTMIELLVSQLNEFGHHVVVAKDGQEGVALFRDFAPDLVLMDIEMPVMNGFEATRQIREYEATLRWAWTPIIFLTINATTQSLVRAIDSGADDFMSKTTPMEVLHAKIKSMSRIAALREQLSVAIKKLEQI